MIIDGEVWKVKIILYGGAFCCLALLTWGVRSASERLTGEAALDVFDGMIDSSTNTTVIFSLHTACYAVRSTWTSRDPHGHHVTYEIGNRAQGWLGFLGLRRFTTLVLIRTSAARTLIYIVIFF